ncbi:hypothetical protein [Duganella aceris]|uniref:Uncharacterized protein n=1 Tax=Duganella aceris TaxID=2703883 RepID=A0ABX0FJJ0_9BURK|nr:hypothetical protein [Duganella aceris]NGZ84745.1 hypothetical protein [Duganella aceris]
MNDTDAALMYMQQRYYDPVLADANNGVNFNRHILIRMRVVMFSPIKKF